MKILVDVDFKNLIFFIDLITHDYDTKILLSLITKHLGNNLLHDFGGIYAIEKLHVSTYLYSIYTQPTPT